MQNKGEKFAEAGGFVLGRLDGVKLSALSIHMLRAEERAGWHFLPPRDEGSPGFPRRTN